MIFFIKIDFIVSFCGDHSVGTDIDYAHFTYTVLVKPFPPYCGYFVPLICHYHVTNLVITCLCVCTDQLQLA